jgi:hypothetical protein
MSSTLLKRLGPATFRSTQWGSSYTMGKRWLNSDTNAGAVDRDLVTGELTALPDIDVRFNAYLAYVPEKMTIHYSLLGLRLLAI